MIQRFATYYYDASTLRRTIWRKMYDWIVDKLYRCFRPKRYARRYSIAAFIEDEDRRRAKAERKKKK